MPPGIVTPSVPEFLVLLFEQTAKDIVQETENMAPATQASVSPRETPICKAESHWHPHNNAPGWPGCHSPVPP